MLPPEVMPERTIRSVGVVSNFSRHNVVVANDNAIILPCDADTVKEYIALAFADAGVMERVVVLDSLLYHPDSTASHILSGAEVNALCRELDVEMLYSIDYACLIYNPAARFISRPLNAYLCTRIYTPDRDSIHGTSIMDKETLDYWVNDADEMGELIPQIPQLLAQAAISPYLPSWKERERVFYYDRLCYALREAKVYVAEGNWEAAAEQWQQLLDESKLQAYRFMAAYNLALYYEMTDDIDAALRMLDTAKGLATKTTRRGEERSIALDTTFVEQYREVLKERKKELEKLEL
ncbi:MAG: tetratricopeptide repeat protein [Bacteroidaceae bacterium]|nr:tetratricopeptide repeat protein [Bacteroidaceae bacterium]